jgi:OmpA-OmpF porin, OOP family
MFCLSRSDVILRIARVVSWITIAAALLSGAASQAQFYVGGEAGWTGLFDRTDTISAVTSAIARFNGGFNGGVRGGYQWGSWRFEEEYSYRQNGARDLVGQDFALKAGGGNRHSNSIMTNVVYDFTLGYPITPHVGFGVGAANVFDGLKLPRSGQLFNNSDWRFGYQGIAGIRYNISPALTVDLDYRYFAAIASAFDIPRTTLYYYAYYKTHNFVVSLIYRFAVPPAMPVSVSAAGASSVPQTSLVFFDWDRARHD